MTSRAAAGLLAVLLLASCAGTEVPNYFWPPDQPVRPFLDRPSSGEDAESGRRLEQYVVLLPDEEGTVGSIQVTQGELTATLDQAYQAVRFDALEEPYFVDPPQEEARDEFSAAITHEPPAPATYVVFFELDSTRMTPASQGRMEAALADIRGRAAPQVWLSGHTDRSGSDAKNLSLSRDRAQAVAGLLQRVAIPADVITLRWYGEQQPIVATADGVEEPRNRRVVITVR